MAAPAPEPPFVLLLKADSEYPLPDDDTKSHRPWRPTAPSSRKPRRPPRTAWSSSPASRGSTRIILICTWFGPRPRRLSRPACLRGVSPSQAGPRSADYPRPRPAAPLALVLGPGFLRRTTAAVTTVAVSPHGAGVLPSQARPCSADDPRLDRCRRLLARGCGLRHAGQGSADYPRPCTAARLALVLGLGRPMSPSLAQRPAASGARGPSIADGGWGRRLLRLRTVLSLRCASDALDRHGAAVRTRKRWRTGRRGGVGAGDY